MLEPTHLYSPAVGPGRAATTGTSHAYPSTHARGWDAHLHLCLLYLIKKLFISEKAESALMQTQFP